MRVTQGAMGMLVQRYKGILKKCHLLNALGGVVVSALLLGGSNMAFAAAPIVISDSHQVADGITEEYTTIMPCTVPLLPEARILSVSALKSATVMPEPL